MDLNFIIRYIALPILSISFILSFIRVIKGPELQDRVVAFDLLAIITIAFIACFAVTSGLFVLMDAAIVLALISFLGTTAFAFFIGKDKDND